MGLSIYRSVSGRAPEVSSRQEGLVDVSVFGSISLSMRDALSGSATARVRLAFPF